MTTQVTIKSPAPNHCDVLIKAVCPPTGCVMIERRLREGEEATLYLHDGQCLHIYEVAKEQEAATSTNRNNVSDSECAACPCGEIPPRLCIVEKDGKWAMVAGYCCGDWHVEFRTQYHPIGSPELYALALSAWNGAPRAKR